VRRFSRRYSGQKVAVGPFAGLADGTSLCSFVRVERAQQAGGEMSCHDSLGSIPNQISRLDAGFGIYIKPIDSAVG